MHDVAIIGGGIVGASVAWQLKQASPDADVILIEKENRIAAHQTGRNSGVIHAGLYYQPGSMKAAFCRAGVPATVWFSREHDIPFEQCGKLVVATDAAELERMKALFARSQENGIRAEMIGEARLRELEPRIAGTGAILSPTTGIADYEKIALKMADMFTEAGGELLLGVTVRDLREERDGVVVSTDRSDIRARHLIVCGGLQADRLAAMMGLADDFRILPFRGEYYMLGDDKVDIVKHLIYPVPNPRLPFLGVHLTRMIRGGVTLGPNAVFSLAREHYDANRPGFRDLASALGYSGLWRLAAKYAGSAFVEARSSVSPSYYLERCRKYCPELALDDLKPYPTGIRAMAVTRDGTMIHDFLIKSSKRALHVCNAPSPAATSAMPIGRHIVEQANDMFGLDLDLDRPIWRP